jgi:hypothetical protein
LHFLYCHIELLLRIREDLEMDASDAFHGGDFRFCDSAEHFYVGFTFAEDASGDTDRDFDGMTEGTRRGFFDKTEITAGKTGSRGTKSHSIHVVDDEVGLAGTLEH